MIILVDLNLRRFIQNLKMKTPIPQPDRAIPHATDLSLVKYCVTINTEGKNTIPNPQPETFASTKIGSLLPTV
jgi:hypothetical protein